MQRGHGFRIPALLLAGRRQSTVAGSAPDLGPAAAHFPTVRSWRRGTPIQCAALRVENFRLVPSFFDAADWRFSKAFALCFGGGTYVYDSISGMVPVCSAPR